jgi:hypothetical protein
MANTETNMSKLTMAGLPLEADAIIFPTSAMMMRVQKNCWHLKVLVSTRSLHLGIVMGNVFWVVTCQPRRARLKALETMVADAPEYGVDIELSLSTQK